MRTVKEQQHGGEIDFWETPSESVEAVMPYLPSPIGSCQGGLTLIDPGAGTGAVSIAAVKAGLPVARVIAIENNDALADECDARFDAAFAKWKFEFEWRVIRADWLDWEPTTAFAEQGGAVMVLGNPPYSRPYQKIGTDFAVKALQVAKLYCGVVGLLMPLDFATGTDRTKRIHSRTSMSVYPLRRRPHFGGPHSTGKRPFAWFLCDHGRKSQPTYKVIG